MANDYEIMDGTLATVRIRYRNHRGEVSVRTILPRETWYGETRWHKHPQYFLRAWCEDRKSYRDFAMCDILEWGVNERTNHHGTNSGTDLIASGTCGQMDANTVGEEVLADGPAPE